MPQVIIQSSFQFGEVSPLLFAQGDSPIYTKSARELRNVVVIPQGGVEKRFGTKYVATIPTVTNYLNIKPVWFDYDDGSKYYLVFTDLQLVIYYLGAIVKTIVTTYTEAQVKQLDFAQSSKALYITHGSHSPAILTRTSAHAGWNLDAAPTFVHYPTYDFDQNYDTFSFNVYETTTSTALVTTNNLLGWVVDLVSTSAVFTADHVGGLYFGDSGTLRITALTSTTRVVAKIIQVFDNDSNLFHTGSAVLKAISGDQSVLTEKAFSTTRGWPEKVAFFQNRIWFARTSELLGGVWGSVFNGFNASKLNFNDSEALDTSAISTTLIGTKAVIIKDIVSFKTLIVTTSNGLYATPLLIESPITPSNVDFVNKQTSDTSTTVKPVAFDNEVIFADKGGRKIKNISVAQNGYNYETHNISVLAPHLINSPTSMDVYQNSDIKDGSWLMAVNSGADFNGSLAIYQSVPEQSISAWTLSTTSQTATDGYFRHVTSLDEKVYFIVERTINGGQVFYIEELDFDLNTDSGFTATYGGATTVITGLSHLEGESVTVIGDGAPVTDADTTYTVASGQITLATGVTTIEVGLLFTPSVKPMPLNVPTQSGSSLYLPKTINIVYVDYFESASITVNGTQIAPYQLGSYVMGSPPTLATDFAKIEPMGGWDPRQVIEISQAAPVSFTVIGVGYEVTVG